MIVALILVAISYVGDQNGSGWAIGGLALYMAMFSVGAGPGAWLIPSEVRTVIARKNRIFVDVGCHSLSDACFVSSLSRAGFCDQYPSQGDVRCHLLQSSHRYSHVVHIFEYSELARKLGQFLLAPCFDFRYSSDLLVLYAARNEGSIA